MSNQQNHSSFLASEAEPSEFESLPKNQNCYLSEVSDNTSDVSVDTATQNKQTNNQDILREQSGNIHSETKDWLKKMRDFKNEFETKLQHILREILNCKCK